MCSYGGPRYTASVKDGDVTFYDLAVTTGYTEFNGHSVPVFSKFRMPVGELLRMFADITRQHRQEQARKAFIDPAMA